MAFVPISTTTDVEQRGRQRVCRITPGHRFVPFAGRLQRIEDVARVVCDEPDERCEVRIGDDWVRLEPATAGMKSALKGKVVERINRGRHFGPVLDLRGSGRLDTVEWKVTSSRGDLGLNGLELVRLGGVPLGMFWQDWCDTLGKNCVAIAGDRITLDLRGKQGRIVNLDPTVDIDDSAAQMYQYADSWDAARDATDANQPRTLNGTIGNILVYNFDGGTYVCSRGMLRFDTSDYGAATAAVLYVKTNALGGTTNTHISRCEFESPLAFARNPDNFGKVKTGYTSTPVGYLADAGSDWGSIDLLADPSDWAASATYDIGLATRNDVTNTQVNMAVGAFLTGDNAPYIEVTMPAASSGYFDIPRGQVAIPGVLLVDRRRR